MEQSRGRLIVKGGRRSRGTLYRAATVLVLFALLSSVWTTVQADLPYGLPPIHQIPPEPGIYPSFYSVAQSPDGVIHIGGMDGIHSYDGRRWQFMAMPNGNIVRSLIHGGNQRLYVGGYGMFGYARQKPDGLLEFVDLTPPDEKLTGDNILADIWQILVTPEGVYFVGLHYLFLYDPDSGRIDSWYHAERFGAMTRYDGHTLVQFREVGIKVFNGQGFELVDGGELLPTHLYALLPLPEGGLLTLGRDGRWLRFHEGRVEPWSGGEALPSSGSFSAWTVLPDQSYALAKPDGGLYVVDTRSRQVRRFQIANDYVTDLIVANDGGLLLQSDTSTVHVSWPSAWTKIGSDSGLRGRVHALDRWQDRWLAVTNAGVLHARRSSSGLIEFQRTDVTPFEAWDWLSLDDGTALLAESYSLIHLDGDSTSVISNDRLYPRLIKPSRFNDHYYYVGTELGLALFERSQEGWESRFIQQDFTGLVSSLIELTPGHLLVAIAGQGIVEVRFNSDFSDLEYWHRFDVESGIDYGDNNAISLFRLGDDSIMVATSGGFFEWHDGRFERTDLSGLDALRKSNTAYRVKVAPDRTWWAYSHENLLRRPPGQDWIVEDLTMLNPGVISSLKFNENGQVLVGGVASVLRFDPAVEVTRQPPARVALRSVILTTADGREQRLPLDGREIVVENDLVNMIFEYALPSYRRPELTRYQSRMTGYEDHFSDWSNVTRITFSYFTPGEYSFVVRARDGQNRISESDPFEFVILPPWYMALWARIVWILLALAILVLGAYGLLKWRLARVVSERERLSNMVDLRTAELAAANRKLEDMANVDGLTAVANRRRLDEYMTEAWNRCIDRGCDVSVILIDADHFKEYNDTHGHQAGDDVLRKMARILAETLRRNEDVVGRYGGEEFMCILPGAPHAMAMEVAQTIRKRIDDAFEGISVSVGLATVRPKPENDFTTLIERADQALYAAKQAGRNRVCQAP